MEDNRKTKKGVPPSRWRRRLLAAACAWCAETVPGFAGWDADRRLGYAREVCLRAAGYVNQDPRMFNRIGTDRMRSLYNAFVRRRRDMESVAAIGKEACDGE